jgi:hypothetical protein
MEDIDKDSLIIEKTLLTGMDFLVAEEGKTLSSMQLKCLLKYMDGKVNWMRYYLQRVTPSRTFYPGANKD